MKLLYLEIVLKKHRNRCHRSSFAKRTVRVVSITKLGHDEHANRYAATLEIERDFAVPILDEQPKKLGRFVLVSIVKNVKILNSPILMAAGILDV